MEPMVAAIAVVFLAELGDKTQLVALGLGARYRLGPVLVGVVLAYVASVTVSVGVGAVVGSSLPTRLVGLAGGAAFVTFGIWTAWADADGGDEEVEADPTRVVWSVAVAMFVAELGDKTMLATATLAARGDPLAVWLGASIGIIAAGMVGVVVGRVLGTRLPERATRLGSAVLFVLFGVTLVLTSW